MKLKNWSQFLGGVCLLFFVVIWSAIITGELSSAQAQGFGNFRQDHGRAVLKVLKGDLEKNYYDPAIRGAAMDSYFKQAEERIKAATSTGQVFGIIAEALVELDDSHTFFLPPERASRTQYGWQMQMIGDNCFVVSVKARQRR